MDTVWAVGIQAGVFLLGIPVCSRALNKSRLRVEHRAYGAGMIAGAAGMGVGYFLEPDYWWFVANSAMAYVAALLGFLLLKALMFRAMGRRELGEQAHG